MRIGLNLLYVAPGVAGGGVYARKLLAGLAAVDPAGGYTAYTRGDVDLPDLPPNWFRHVRTPVDGRSVLWRTFWEYAVLPGKVRREKFDVFHGLGSLSPVPGGGPTVLTIHDLIYRHFPASVPRGHQVFMTWMLPRVARKAARVIVPSEYTANDVVHILKVPRDRVRIVPYGPGAEYRPVEDAAAVAGVLTRLKVRRPYVVTVARGYPHKNLVGLLDAFARLRARGRREEQLVLVGEPYRAGDAVDRRVKELGLGDAVVCTGRIDDADLQALYTAATAFAFPSLAEGLGLPVLEAMSCGVPVVASDATAIPEGVGDAGLLADARDPDAFADALGRVLADDGLRAELRRKGFDRARLFSWRRCAEQTVAVYRELG